MAGLLVKDVMIKHPMSIPADMDLTLVVDTLLQYRITGLPVVDNETRVIGFVSEQDCLRQLLVSSYHGEGAVRVEQVMHGDPLTVDVEESLVDLAELMLKQKPKIYPVVDEKRRLIGLLTRGHVLRALRDSRRGG